MRKYAAIGRTAARLVPGAPTGLRTCSHSPARPLSTAGGAQLIGFIGLGNMGKAMCGNVLAARGRGSTRLQAATTLVPLSKRSRSASRRRSVLCLFFSLFLCRRDHVSARTH
jgi:hypothetical protein